MAFDTTIDRLDLMVASLPWKRENDKLVLKNLPGGYGKRLTNIPGARKRLALFAKRAGVQMAQIFDPVMLSGSCRILACEDESTNAEQVTMISTSTIETMSTIITDPYNTPVAPQIDISWDECWKSPDAMWVIDQTTQRVLYANPAAIAANGNKPPLEILNAEINALWEDEALDSLTRLVNRTQGWLREHSNVGYRWGRNEADGGVIWQRKRHEFHVDYHRINYLGLECRFEHVKAAIAV